MQNDLQAWSARNFPNAEFVPAKSKCDLIPLSDSSRQWNTAPCTLAIRDHGSSDVTKVKVWSGSNGSAILFHVDDPHFDRNDNEAWRQLFASGQG